MTTKKPTKKIKTNIHHIFHTDKNLQEEGAWITVNDLYNLKVKIRRMKSESVTKANERIIKELFGEARLRKPDDFNKDQAEAITKQLLVEAIIVDWQNVRDVETGEIIPYSLEAAKELVEIEDFRDFLFQAADSRDSFREQLDADAEGN